MNRRNVHIGSAAAAGVLLAGLATAPAHAVTAVGCSTAALVGAINASNGIPGGDTLDLTPYCVYTLTDGDGSLPSITQPLTIHGHNATIRRDPAATLAFRIFTVSANSISGPDTLTMDTLTVMNGNDPTGGGGVLLPDDDVHLVTTNVNFQGNSAGSGDGGAILASAATGASISLKGGTVSDNSSITGLGGGVMANNDADVTLDSVTMTRNRSSSGGAVRTENSSGALIIKDCIITNNTVNPAFAGGGGGVNHQGVAGSSVTITGSTITNNHVQNGGTGGGGVRFREDDAGTVLTITDSTISGNSIVGFNGDTDSKQGAGIHQSGGILTVSNTRVAGNRIVGQNGQGAGIAVNGFDSAGTLILQNGTTVTGNLASGQYSQGGGVFSDNDETSATLLVSGSQIDGNKVTGTGSVAGGLYNTNAFVSLANSSVDNNIAPAAPAPGGVSTVLVPISSVSGTTITGNTPTNCLRSPMPVATCSN
ncbi:hypothetical protein ABZ845_02470 [Streptomyces sp. NPDC047022]|uniref:hypothetical protein n=1 Tax=Streptomyces sp. NPDC047022 TaxID=3155737 RepID=UPI0033C81E71